MIFGRTLYEDETYRLVGGLVPLWKMELHRTGHKEFYTLNKIERQAWQILAKDLSAMGCLEPQNPRYCHTAKYFIETIVGQSMHADNTALQFAHQDFMDQADMVDWDSPGYEVYLADQDEEKIIPKYNKK